MDKDAKPVLRRDLEFIPVEQGEEKYVVISDQLGLVGEGKAVPRELFPVLAMMDGDHSLADIRDELARSSGGVLVSMEEIQAVVDNLDQFMILETPAFFQAKEKLVKGFTDADIRPAQLAGSAYPASPEELAEEIDSMIQFGVEAEIPGPLLALAAPHMDINSARRAYGSAYRALKDSGFKPRRVVVLGVGHTMPEGLFSLTTKDFETPLGTTKTDKEAVAALAASAPGIIAPDDLAHWKEHSVEFQLIFLQHLLGPQSFTLVPVLCGCAAYDLPEYSRKSFVRYAGGFLEALKPLMDGETLFIAGVDLCHAGLKFGHEQPSDDLEEAFMEHDNNLLQAMDRLDRDGFWAESARVDDRYNVCGFTALATLLETLPPCRPRVLDYMLYRERATSSAVSFMAAMFTGED